MRLRRPRAVRALALAAAGAVLLTACGSGEAATTDPEPAAEAETDAETDAEDRTGTAQDTGAETPTEVTVSHAQGETTVPFDPQTVVTFDLGALDTLDALGVEVAGVPEVASLPDRLAQYAGDDYAKVGTLFEPDYEAVNALEPDLIIVAGRSAPVYPELSEIAPTIDVTVDNADFADSVIGHVETLGEIFGEQDRVADEIATLESRIDAVADVGAQAGTGLILLTTGGEVSAYGPGSRFGIIHDLLGVTPAADDLTDATHGDAVSFEYILEADPDHLFVIDRDATIGESGAAAEVVLDNELVAQTTAWQEGNVTYLDGVDWYLLPTGLRSVGNMIAAVEAAVS